MSKTSSESKHDINKGFKREKTSKYFENTNSIESKSKLTLIKDNEEVSEKSKKRKIEIKYESKEPKNWEKVLENIREMRSERDAVVDRMGAEMCFDRNAVKESDQRFQVLVSLMLSSQTRDESTHSAMNKLKEYGLTIDHMIDTSVEQLSQLIKNVSFYNTKAKHIKKTALILKNEYNSDIPKSIESLMSLPGVGPKMSHLAMKIAWNECTGIAVDTHVHRICNRLKWTQSKSAEQTRKQFELWLPKHHWNDINILLVGFGQTICKPRNPNCNQCLNQNLCPYALSLKTDF